MDGIVVLLKPPGMTSSNMVYDVRKLFGEKRVGHLGTLDPAAAGVLPVCLGRATKLFDLLVDKEKEYVFEIAFGLKTDTQDASGVLLERDERAIEAAQLQQVLPSFLGEQMQTASVYSALKVGGKKLYDLARAGETVEPKTRRIVVSSLDFLTKTGENRFLLKVVCSRGTYVRSLCESIAEALGTLAYMPFLLRTRSGPFSIERAFTLADLQTAAREDSLKTAVVSCEEALSFLPALCLPAERSVPTRNGLETSVRGQGDGTVRVYAGGEFLGVGQVSAGQAKLSIHLY